MISCSSGTTASFSLVTSRMRSAAAPPFLMRTTRVRRAPGRTTPNDTCGGSTVTSPSTFPNTGTVSRGFFSLVVVIVSVSRSWPSGAVSATLTCRRRPRLPSASKSSASTRRPGWSSSTPVIETGVSASYSTLTVRVARLPRRQPAQVELVRLDRDLRRDLAPQNQRRDRVRRIVTAHVEAFALSAEKAAGIEACLNAAGGARRNRVVRQHRRGTAARRFHGFDAQGARAAVGEPEDVGNRLALLDVAEVEHRRVHVQPRSGGRLGIGVRVPSGRLRRLRLGSGGRCGVDLRRYPPGRPAQQDGEYMDQAWTVSRRRHSRTRQAVLEDGPLARLPGRGAAVFIRSRSWSR